MYAGLAYTMQQSAKVPRGAPGLTPALVAGALPAGCPPSAPLEAWVPLPLLAVAAARVKPLAQQSPAAPGTEGAPPGSLSFSLSP